MPGARDPLGPLAESRAAEYLVTQGLSIVHRNYRSRLGEIDLVALDGNTVVFVEVKARRSRARGSARDAVTPAKQKRLLRLGQLYLAQHRLGRAPCRFDVVACQVEGENLRLEHIPNAFQAPS